jgi:PIN domain nuclease of toxin-antitoxin system
MDGLLLDTHTLIWLVADDWLEPAAEYAIAAAQKRKQLFVSHITVWEAGLASQKSQIARRPNLLGRPADVWFLHAVKQTGSKVFTISQKVALEASRVPAVYGSGDPGDCFLIPTARIHDLTLVTRDTRMIEMAKQEPNYLRVLPA